MPYHHLKSRKKVPRVMNCFSSGNLKNHITFRCHDVHFGRTGTPSQRLLKTSYPSERYCFPCKMFEISLIWVNWTDNTFSLSTTRKIIVTFAKIHEKQRFFNDNFRLYPVLNHHIFWKKIHFFRSKTKSVLFEICLMDLNI